MEKNTVSKVLASLGVGLTSGAVLISPEGVQTIVNSLSAASQSQIAQAGFFFTLAALIHSGRMKKEIRLNFEGLTVAIDRVSSALRDDLRKHGERLDTHGKHLDNLTGRVDNLENGRINHQQNKELGNA
jgi:hypothetical protein